METKMPEARARKEPQVVKTSAAIHYIFALVTLSLPFDPPTPGRLAVPPTWAAETSVLFLTEPQPSPRGFVLRTCRLCDSETTYLLFIILSLMESLQITATSEKSVTQTATSSGNGSIIQICSFVNGS